MAIPTQCHPPFAIEIDLPFYVNDYTYVPEPPVEDVGRIMVSFCLYSLHFRW